MLPFSIPKFSWNYLFFLQTPKPRFHMILLEPYPQFFQEQTQFSRFSNYLKFPNCLSFQNFKMENGYFFMQLFSVD